MPAHNPNPRSHRTTIDLPTELLRAIDEARGGESRNAWLARAARLMLQSATDAGANSARPGREVDAKAP